MQRFWILGLLCLGLGTAWAQEGESGDGPRGARSYKAASLFLRNKQFDLAEPLLKKAREEAPESLEILAASSFCAEKLGEEERSLMLLKTMLRLSVRNVYEDEQDVARLAKAMRKFEEMSPVEAALLRCARLFRKESKRLGDKDPENILAALSEKYMEEALGQESEAIREAWAKRSLSEAKEMRQGGRYEAALHCLNRVRKDGVSSETRDQIESLTRSLRLLVDAEDRFVGAAKSWNAYVDFARNNPNDLDGRNKRLWRLQKKLHGSVYPRMVQLTERVRREIAIVEQAMGDR